MSFILPLVNMPGFDTTGPNGQGPRTGRGMGPCAKGFGFGRGCGRGFGLGRFFGFRGLSKEEELEMLEQDAKDIENRMKELKSQK